MDYYRKDQHTQTDESCLSGSNSDSDSGGKDRRKVRKNKAQQSKRLSKNCDMDCDKNTAKTSAKPSVTFSSNSYQEVMVLFKFKVVSGGKSKTHKK